MLRYESVKHRHILANWGVVRQLVCEKHGLDQKDLDVLLYFYGTKQGIFSYENFKLYRRSFPHFRNRFDSYLKKKKLFVHYRKPAPKQPALFMLSHSAVAIVDTMYRQLFGEIPIRTATDKTTMYGKALPLHEKAVSSGLVDLMNAESKQLRLSPESE